MGHTCTIIKDKAYIYGGKTINVEKQEEQEEQQKEEEEEEEEEKVVNELLIYKMEEKENEKNKKRVKFEKKMKLELPPLIHHISFHFGDKLFFFGGLNHENEVSNGMYQLDFENFECKKIDFLQNGKNEPLPRFLHSFAIVNHFLVVFGGKQSFGSDQNVSQIEIIDLNNFRCEISSKFPSIPNHFSSHFVYHLENHFESSFYLLGDSNNQNQTLFNFSSPFDHPFLSNCNTPVDTSFHFDFSLLSKNFLNSLLTYLTGEDIIFLNLSNKFLYTFWYFFILFYFHIFYFIFYFYFYFLFYFILFYFHIFNFIFLFEFHILFYFYFILFYFYFILFVFF